MCRLKRDIRFTFKGLWEVCADDFGRFDADPRVVKGKVWPRDDDITVKKIAAWLRLLHEHGRILLYDVGGESYGYILNWFKHQKVSHPTASRYPAPPGINPDSFRSDSGNMPEDFGPERSGADRIGEDIERSGADEASIPACDPDPLDLEERPVPPAPRVVLPREAYALIERCYSLSTEKRRLDVTRQLYDTLDPRSRGARLRRGVNVKARDGAHLGAACQAVLDDPPRSIDAAIVFVLQKLQDAPPGPPVTEVLAKEHEERVQLASTYQRKAKSAGIAWATDPANRDAYAEIVKRVEGDFAAAGASEAVKLGKDAVLTQLTSRAAGFPAFEVWSKNGVQS